MKIKGLFNSRYIGWLVVVAAIIFWYFFYFFSYIPNQEAQLKKRGFRILEEFSSNMFEKHQYYENHFKNFAPYYQLRDSNDVISANEMPRAISFTVDGLRKEIVRINDSVPYRFKNNGGNPSFYFNPNDTNETFIVPVETFMEGMRFDRLFESIVFFDSTEVFYSSDSKIAFNITHPEVVIDSVYQQQGGFVKIIQVRGEKKHALVLPFNFLDKRFYLAGIISDSAFKNKTRSINFQLMILISGLLLVLLVGIPILKILLIDAYDHLDASDPHRVVISFIVVTGILALISIGSTYHKIIDRKEQKNRLEQISDSIYSNIQDDLKTLTLFSDSIIKGNDLNAKGVASLLSDSVFPGLTTDTVFELNELILMDSTGIADVVYSVKDSVNFSIKTTINSKDIQQLNLSSRLYFQNAKDTSKSWYSGIIKRHYYLQSIMSYNTGRKEMALSFSVAPKVFAVTSPVPSLFDHVIPHDAEFAVIDSKGEVLFHSQQSKNLHENFLNECEANPILKSAVELRTAEKGRIKYNEKPWLFRAIPMEDTPLTLVTLLDIKQMQKRNTRIILFTFYFFVVTLICILIWMLILKAIQPGDKFVKTQSWLFDWLHFNKENYAHYKQFFAILIVLVITQLLGGFMIDEPVTMFVFQLVFILFSGIAGLIVLGNIKFNIQKFYRKEHFPSTLLLILLVVLIILFAFLLKKQLWVLFILIVPLLLGRYLYFLMINQDSQLINRIQQKLRLNVRHVRDERWIRNIYNFCLILWLMSLSFVPVLHYYLTVQKQEERIWRKQQLFELAQKSLKHAHESESDLKFFRFSGFPKLTATYDKNQWVKPDSLKKSKTDADAATTIYNLLSDPLTEVYESSALIRDSSYHFEWVMPENMDSLIYANPSFAGRVKIENNGFGKRIGLLWLFLLIPSAIVLIFIWFVLGYSAEFVFYTKQQKWQVNHKFSIGELISTNPKKRLIINSFNGDKLRHKIKEELQKKTPEIKFDNISATLLIQEGTEVCSADKNSIVYVSDLEQCIHHFRKQSLLLERLGEIHCNTEGNVLLAMPFEPEFIEEAIDDFISNNNPDDEFRSELYQIKSRWVNLLSQYEQIYYSALKAKVTGTTEHEHSRNKLFYAFVWNNLCRFEKLVLYDLTHDGLINLKNEKMIYRLMRKGLIDYNKYLKPYSPGLKYFVNNSIHPDEKKDLERSANLKGMWNTMRYPIIIVLVIIAVFIFISQGYSIEKVTAIFAGILTLMATMTKLFEGG